MAEHSGLNEELLEDLYAWIDSVPLSRPKKDLRRDFSDGGTKKCTSFAILIIVWDGWC